MPIFVTIPGIPGESLDKDHPDAIDVRSFSWGLSNPGSATAKKVGPASFQDLNIEKDLDRSTTKLAMACAAGTRLSEVVLDETVSFTEFGRVTLLSIKLWDAVVADVSESGAEDGRPTDSISFDFPKVEIVYTLFDSKGKKKGTERFAWDLTTQKEF